ncbi:MAG TPA: ABC transporter permease [Bryobacteraceae bacterium]|nr:ABC transporter permease [Bryobacteraceae bacterium]
MKTFLDDFRFGLRMLRKSPSFTVVAIFTLALGIGANTAIFSAVNSVLLRPLPYHSADRLAMLWNDNRRMNLHEDLTSYPNFADWRSQSRLFEDMAAFSENGADVTGVDVPYEVFGWRVGANLFSILGVSPAIGRTFTKQEEERGHASVVILSDGLWRERFGADPNVLGRTMLLDGNPYVIVGVMPASFQFPDKRTEIWTPLALSDQTKANRGGLFLHVLGKLKPGASFEQARAEMTALGTNLERQYPNSNAGTGIWVVPLLNQVVGNLRTGLLVLFAAVGFVLLIACANVANLFLARGAGREREIAVRAALGAGRARLIRQLLTESFVFSVPAGLAGLLVAYGSLRALIALAPADMPRLDEIAMDARVLWFTFAMSLASALFFGLVPAFRISRSDLNESLREGGRGMAGALRASFARSSLLIAEVALSMVLLAGAGLMVRSLIHLRALNPGFDSSNVLTMQLSAPYAKFSKGVQVAALYSRILDRLNTVPMVRSAGLITDIFLSSTPNSGGFSVEGKPLPPIEQRVEATTDSVSPNYFKALRVPLIAGRFFDDRDQAGSLPVALINQTMAKQFWPNEDPVGKRFHFGWGTENVHWLTVVGVVGDMRRQGLDKTARVETFSPLTQEPRSDLNLVIRTPDDPLKAAGIVESELRAVEKELVIQKVMTLDHQLGESLSQRRFQTWLLGLFSGIALLLAAVGIYGVMYHSVTQRIHEFGVRLALGARASDLLRMVFGQAVMLVGAGAIIGTLAALILTRFVATLLYGVSPTDPFTYVAVFLVLITCALVASYLPARRAMKVDPMIALRYE